MDEGARLAIKPYSRRPVTSGETEELNRILDQVEKAFDNVQAQINALSPSASKPLVTVGPLVAGRRQVTFYGCRYLDTYWFADTPGGAGGTPPTSFGIPLGLNLKEDITNIMFRIISDNGLVSFIIQNTNPIYVYRSDGAYAKLTF